MIALNETLKKAEFLIGKWKSRAENQFGEKGIIEGTFDVIHNPGSMFIATTGESRADGKLVNKATTYMTYDQNIGKYVRKSIYSYGWILNEVGDWKGDRLELDVVSIDCEPDFFKGTRWRSFIHKYSDDEIGLGLEVSRNGEPFRVYGETRAKRVKTR